MARVANEHIADRTLYFDGRPVPGKVVCTCGAVFDAGSNHRTEMVLSALFAPSRTPCATCGGGEKQVAGWCEFDGTADGCTSVTEFTGGNASGVVRWKTTTYGGGWIGSEEFNPGDTILRRTDGTFSVGSYKAWAQRLSKIVGCPDCTDGFVDGPSPADGIYGLREVNDTDEVGRMHSRPVVRVDGEWVPVYVKGAL